MEPVHTIQITTGTSWRPRVVRECLEYRDLLFSFVRRDVTLRYTQTLIGPMWVLIQPALVAALFAFAFGTVARISLNVDVPYFIFALVGMSLWVSFGQTLSRATISIVGNTDLVTKVYFPRILLPFSSAAASFLDALVIQAGLALYLLVLGPGLSMNVVFLPVIDLCMFAVGACVAAGLGAVMVRFRDVQYAIPLLVQGLLLMSPIVYPLATVGGVARDISDFNPLSVVFEALRWALLSTPGPTLSSLVLAGAVLSALSLSGLCLFSRMERGFADLI